MFWYQALRSVTFATIFVLSCHQIPGSQALDWQQLGRSKIATDYDFQTDHRRTGAKHQYERGLQRNSELYEMLVNARVKLAYQVRNEEGIAHVGAPELVAGVGLESLIP